MVACCRSVLARGRTAIGGQEAVWSWRRDAGVKSRWMMISWTTVARQPYTGESTL